jgi:hypothetical protein
MQDELTGANSNTGRSGQAGDGNPPRSRPDVPSRDDTSQSEWPPQEPRPGRRPRQPDRSRGNGEQVEGRDNGRNRGIANRWNRASGNRSSAQNRGTPRQRSDLPILMTLPNAPPQVNFRRVVPRVRGRRLEPGRSRWDEQPTRGQRQEQPVRTQWEEQPTRSQREELERSRWRGAVVNTVPGAQTRSVDRRPTGHSQTCHVRPVEQNQASVREPVVTEPREHAANVEPSTRMTATTENQPIAIPAAHRESRSPKNTDRPTEQTPAHMQVAKAPHVHPRNEPFFINEEWKKQPDVTVFFGPGLNKFVTVKDIFVTIKDFGTVEMIDIIVDNNGDRTGKALARLSNVTTPFWESGSIIFGFGFGRVPMKKLPYMGASTVASKSNPSKIYPAKLVSLSASKNLA